MKLGHPRSGDSGMVVSGITAENYTERACSFLATRGTEGFPIRAIDGSHGSTSVAQPATEPQWLAWMAYFDKKGVKCAFLRKRGWGMVPCEWPEDFDHDCRASDRLARLPRHQLYHGPIPKARWKSLLGEIHVEPRPDNVPALPSLGELKELYAAKPLLVSEAFKAHIKPKEDMP